jgi:chemotaxis protein CheY-P-specific phosphatase CheC
LALYLPRTINPLKESHFETVKETMHNLMGAQVKVLENVSAVS